MMLVVLLLVGISLFFPPVWLAVMAYVVYLVLTRKKRRNRIIMYEIHKSIQLNQEERELKHIYYEAAKSFAAEHGARMSRYKNDSEDDCLIFRMNVSGIDYNICVQKCLKGDTVLTVRTEDQAKEDFRSKLSPELAALFIK